MNNSTKKFNTLSIEDLLKELNSLKAKGITTVKLSGTLMADGDGNSIIASTEKQF